MSNAETTLTLDIHDIFQLAAARNRLRQAASAHRLPLILQARAGGAMTRITELVLFPNEVTKRQLKLVVLIRTDPHRQGIEFQFFAPLRSDIARQVTLAEWQLEQACDELEISENGRFDHVIMRLWARRKDS